ncbi:transposase [Sphingobacterium sp. T2]|uniref:transposase n=1 Tax=Sphingobacterium sp. T2 TaxID=1590596 RepID=UPI00068936B6|nr:helix-turn-helix domain-containing protein [Sphingobacterium sp. T2]
MSKKQKYNFNFKLRLVTTILRGKDSIGSLAKREGLSKSNLQFWLRLYQNYGKQGLQGVAKKSFTIEEKITIIREYHQTGISLMDTCVRYCISNPSVLVQWNKKFQRHGYSGLQETRGRPRQTNTKQMKTKKLVIPGLKFYE